MWQLYDQEVWGKVLASMHTYQKFQTKLSMVKVAYNSFLVHAVESIKIRRCLKPPSQTAVELGSKITSSEVKFFIIQ